MPEENRRLPAASRCFSFCPLGCRSELCPGLIKLPQGILLQCPDCGQMVSQCSEKDYLNYIGLFEIDEGHWPNSRSLMRRTQLNRRKLSRIIKLLKRPAEEIHLLDIGCSSGSLLATSQEMGFNCEGVEPAKISAQKAMDLGLKVFNGMVQDARFPDASFDAVTLLEVIEHLRDPMSMLIECSRIIRENGVMLIGTGNTDSWTAGIMGPRWHYFSDQIHAGHISFFNPRSIKVLAGRTGFTVQSIETKDLRLFEKGDVSSLLYRFSKLIAEPGGLLARIAGKGQQMLAILRRRSV